MSRQVNVQISLTKLRKFKIVFSEFYFFFYFKNEGSISDQTRTCNPHNPIAQCLKILGHGNKKKK